MVKYKKLELKDKLMEDMKRSNGDSKKFWKLLDKMEKKFNDTTFKQGIKDKRWVSHFKSIFNNPEGAKPQRIQPNLES